MNVAEDCRSELLVGARRGRLSDAGRIALDAHLASCPSCRMSREVSADFDGAEAVDLHDGARIRALADRARAKRWRARGAASVVRRGGPLGRRRGCARFAAAAALADLCGSARAPSGGWRWPPRT